MHKSKDKQKNSQNFVMNRAVFESPSLGSILDEKLNKLSIS